jgi:hypothetical protein
MQPIITRRYNGEYSTVLLPNGVVETMWFGKDGTQRLINRSFALLTQHAADVEADAS